jgi:hypothetical protein
MQHQFDANLYKIQEVIIKAFESGDYNSALYSRCAGKYAFCDGTARKIVQRVCNHCYRETKLSH